MSQDIVQQKECKKIITKDSKKVDNGWLLEVLNEKEGMGKSLKGQIYLTVVKPNQQKGFHIHALATYHICCIKGKSQSIFYTDKGNNEIIDMGEDDYKLIKCPPGVAHMIVNRGDDEAFVLVYRDVPWTPDINEQLDINPEDIETDEAWKKIKKFVAKKQLNN